MDIRECRGVKELKERKVKDWTYESGRGMRKIQGRKEKG